MGNPEKSASQISRHESSSPPPYAEAVQESHYETSISPGGAPHTSTNTGISPYRPFPPVLSAHYQWKMITPVFHLGDTTDKRLFAVKVHTGFSGYGPGRPGVVLHNGPTDKHPMLAAAGDEYYASSLSLNGIITLPSLSDGTAERTCTEILRAATSLDTVVFRFSIEVGPNNNELWREDFEWRKSKGNEDKDLVDAPWKCGFKLFRLSPQTGKGSNTPNETLQKIATKDQELVAVFAWSNTLHLMDPFKIEFRGNGKTGALGERFALMTVITGLRLWGLRAQRRTSESKVAAGEAREVPGTAG
ncbi:hypothetical protein K445DRAFT_21604 [Daldinia sp. EC12]|nr:hypothetical protein K445DRAFT_21604 [Daldinia sp. EC12]